MMGPGVVFFGLGFAVCWFIGRYVDRYGDLLQILAVGLFGIAGVIYSLPQIWSGDLLWPLVILFVYGLVASLLFRAGRAARGEGGS